MSALPQARFQPFRMYQEPFYLMDDGPYAPIQFKLGLDKPLPFTPTWSAAPDFLRIIADYCIASKPTVIVECSSGVSTLVLARCCQLNGLGRVYSMEHGLEYAARTRQQLHDFGLEQYASVIHAPLQHFPIGDNAYSWYCLDSLPDSDIDMLVVDGPPGFVQKHSRYPALPLLGSRFSARFALFLDDAARSDEQEIVRLWQAEYPDLTHEYRATERGCSILSRGLG